MVKPLVTHKTFVDDSDRLLLKEGRRHIDHVRIQDVTREQTEIWPAVNLPQVYKFFDDPRLLLYHAGEIYFDISCVHILSQEHSARTKAGSKFKELVGPVFL